MELELALDKHEPYARQRRKSLHPPQLFSIILCGMLPPKHELRYACPLVFAVLHENRK